MKFAIISDCHIGPAPWYKGENRIMSDEATKILEKIVQKINELEDIEFVVQLGDLIQDRLPEADRSENAANLVRGIELFSKLNSPVYHVAGNHDIQTHSFEEMASFFGSDSLWCSFDAGDFLGITLVAKAPQHMNMTIPEEEISWLQKTLEDTEKESLVFLHHPLVTIDLKEHYWFKGKEEKAFIQNREEVRSVLESSGKVKAVFNGHMHIHDFNIQNGIPYFTIQSLVEDVKMNGKPCSAFAIVELNESGILCNICGEDPAEYRFDLSSSSSKDSIVVGQY